MPRQRKSARLHWRERKDGSSTWEIRDGCTRLSTGTSDRGRAEEELAKYLERKHRPSGPIAAQDLSISMLLALYAEEHAVHVADPERIFFAIDALDRFWGDQPVSAITGATCRAYAQVRMTRSGKPAAPGTIRRELGALQSALNYCHAEGYLTNAPRVALPAKPPPKERWLTRQEAAWLLRAARKLDRRARHLQDFILHGLYTGSRRDTILSMHIDTPSTTGGHVDTRTGIFYRRPTGKSGTRKRQNPARLPPRYLAHLRRQARNGRRYVVEDYQGRRVGSIKKSWAAAKVLAMELAAKKGVEIDLTDVTPHTLKHTAITWTLQKGASTWDVAGYFSTSIDTIERVYGHHSPDHQKTAVDALNRRS